MARLWPLGLALFIGVNLLFVARSFVNSLPHGDEKSKSSSLHRDTQDSTIDRGHGSQGTKGSSSRRSGNAKEKEGDKRICRPEEHAEYEGEEVVVAGIQLKTDSAEECCSVCQAKPHCNVFVWCGNPAGCIGDRKYGECWLKHKKDLDPLDPKGRRGEDVGWTSGVVASKAEIYAAKDKLSTIAQKEADRLAALRANESLPLVFFDVEIKGTPIGRIEMVLFMDTSPRCAENFRQFCTGEAGPAPTDAAEGPGVLRHFKGASFYRIIDQFIDQSGVNVESVYGGQFNDDSGGLQLKHEHKGLLSMANMGPNTNTNHFSIMMNPAPHLDTHYTIFGSVVTGMEVIDQINALSKGKPDNTATAEDGAVIVDCGQLRKGTIVPDLQKE